MQGGTISNKRGVLLISCYLLMAVLLVLGSTMMVRETQFLFGVTVAVGRSASSAAGD